MKLIVLNINLTRYSNGQNKYLDNVCENVKYDQDFQKCVLNLLIRIFLFILYIIVVFSKKKKNME